MLALIAEFPEVKIDESCSYLIVGEVQEKTILIEAKSDFTQLLKHPFLEMRKGEEMGAGDGLVNELRLQA